MTYLLEEDLTSQGIHTKTSLQIKLNNRVYVRVKTLAKQFYDRAEKIKKEYTLKNIDTLLIEHKNWIAIWVEKRTNKLDPLESEYLYQVENTHSTYKYAELQLTHKPKKYSFDSEESFKLKEFKPLSSPEKYNGILYKEDLFEKAYSTKESSEVVRSPKMYRGISYEERVSDRQSKKEAISNKFTRKYRGYTY